MSAAQAAKRDKSREWFVVNGARGLTWFVKDRRRAVTLAHKLNGSWSKV